MSGTIYSIYASSGQIITNGLNGTPELGYWCASATPNLSVFSGPRINSCSIAYAQPCGPQQPPCDVSVTKQASHQSPGAGQQISFNIKVVNNSSFTARGIRVQDLVPSGYDLLGFSPQAGYWSNPFWWVGDMNPFQEVQAIMYVRIRSSGSYANTASLAPTGSYYTDWVTANNQSTVTPNVQAFTDLQITKLVDIQYPQINQNVTYTIQVKNNGPGIPVNINVTDFLPSGLQYQSHTATHGNFSPGLWNISNFQLNPGQTATLSVVARVLPTGNYTNSATVSSDLPDPNTANNTASVTIVPQIADLELSLSADNLQPLVGSNATLTLQVKNNGPSNATQVQVNWPLPSGLQYVSASPQQGTAGPTAWSVGTLNQGETTSLTYVVKVLPSGSYLFQPSVNAPLFDPNTGNNQASITLEPTSAFDLEVHKTVNVAQPDYETIVVFSVSAINKTMGTATNVVVTDQLPDG